MRDDVFSAGDLAAIREGAPDEVLEGGCCGGGACDVYSLPGFNFNCCGRAGGGEGFEEVGDAVDGG